MGAGRSMPQDEQKPRLSNQPLFYQAVHAGRQQATPRTVMVGPAGQQEKQSIPAKMKQGIMRKLQFAQMIVLIIVPTLL